MTREKLYDGWYAAWGEHEFDADALVFIRSGEFYETFDDHAKTSARLCGLQLTARGGIPCAGFPAHHAHLYGAKLLDAGFAPYFVG